MQFDTFSEFLSMGDHGLYVWLAYGATAFVLGCYVIANRRIRSKLLTELKWQADTDRPGDQNES